MLTPKLRRSWYLKVFFMKRHICVYLRTKYQVARIFLTAFRQGGGRVGGTTRSQVTFHHLDPRNSWYSLDRPQKDEKLRRPWRHPAVLIMEPLDSESSALTTILPSPTTKRTPQKPSQIRFNKME